MKKVFLIAGHNGTGTGARGYLDEGAETILFRDLLDQALCIKGITPDTDMELEERNLSDIVKWLKSKVGKNDLCIDIHFNAASESANGTEVFVPSNATEYERAVAETLCKTICSTLGTKNRGVKRESQTARKKIAMLSGFDCQQVLLEICFCSNKNDSEKYTSKKVELAEELAKSISKLI